MKGYALEHAPDQSKIFWKDLLLKVVVKRFKDCVMFTLTLIYYLEC